MTREEAIEELKILKENYWDDDGYGHETKQYDDTKLELDMAIKALEQEPTTKIEESNFSQEQYLADIQSAYDCGYAQAKNDLGVDCISRQAVIDAITANCIWENEYNLTSSRIKKAVEKLPSITPISKECVDCISREQALEPYKILENTDTLSVYTIRQNLAELPSMGRYDPYTDKFIKE